MRRNALPTILPILLCLSAGGAVLHAQVFPQLAVGGGFECVIIVSNIVGPDNFHGELMLREGNDAEWSVPFSVNGQPGVNPIQVDLPPRGTQKFVITGGDAIHVGYLLYDAIPPSGPSHLNILLFYNYVSGGRVVESVGVTPSDMMADALFSVEKSATVNTGFAWAKFVTVPFDVTLTLHDSVGNTVQEKVVPFNGHTAMFFTEVFDDVPDGFLGQVRAKTNGQGVAIAVLRQDFADLQLTSTPARYCPNLF